jgi:hypothetical protein
VEDHALTGDVDLEAEGDGIRGRLGLGRLDALDRGRRDGDGAGLGVADAEDPVVDLLAARGVGVPGLRLAVLPDRRDLVSLSPIGRATVESIERTTL